jgi:hypothetical protein
MNNYQLELRQIVDYPRCRIYREFIQTLIADRSIRTGGCSGLFYYVVLCSYANFRTSYEPLPGTKRGHEEEDAIASLQTAARTAANYLRQCGNEVISPENEDDATAEILYNILCRRASSEPFYQRVKSVLADYMAAGRDINTIPVNEFYAPDSIDLISEFAPQLELLYNNSINMISWCRTLYSYDKRSADMEHKENPYYGMPIPAYKKGYRLFANSHLPEKITVFGVGQRNQDIYNADELDRLLGKTVITRTFEEVTGKDIRRIHQMPIPFLPEEREVYNIVLKEFYRIQREYYSSTGNSRKDALMRLIQQITLLLRISAAPDCMKEYEGETPLKEMAVVEALARWPEEVVAIGVRHTTVLDRYAAAIREYLPDRPLFVVTGSTVTFAKRRALRDILRDSRNGILLCTQQSLPSSVNFEFVNKIIIPEMHYNNAGMSQFYMRFVRYTSTEKKDLYFPIYIGSLESNLMQMVLAKEKLTMFMKGQDADMDEIYAKFGVDYDLLSTLMTRETDDEGHLRIHWGEQKIA